MKIATYVAIFLCNTINLLKTTVAAKASPHQKLKNALNQSIRNNRSPFKYTNSHSSKVILHGHKEKPRISKILKFQMDKILSDYEQHLSGGNMNRSRRTEFKNELRSKFNNIQAYSKDRLRKEHDDNSRRRRSRNHAHPRRRIVQNWFRCRLYDSYYMKYTYIETSKWSYNFNEKYRTRCGIVIYCYCNLL